MTREAFRAGSFYPNNKSEIKSFIEKFSIEFNIEKKNNKLYGGIVPHAGWTFSGKTALKLFFTLKETLKNKIDTFLIYGAVHISGLRKASVFPSGYWETPLGEIEVDRELSEMILNLSDIDIEKNPKYHRMEHSIEVQIPFIKYLFPDTKILPIMTPPINTMIEVGKKIGVLLSKINKKVCIIASTDLTHYGPRFGFTKGGLGEKGLEWMKSNDKRIINMVVNMENGKIIDETYKNRNACGGGAIVASLSSFKQLGINKGELLDYTTSYDVHPLGEPSDAVGYASILF